MKGYYKPNRLVRIGGESVSKESIKLFQVDFRETAYLHELQKYKQHGNDTPKGYDTCPWKQTPIPKIISAQPLK